jgi:hypothetical protein
MYILSNYNFENSDYLEDYETIMDVIFDKTYDFSHEQKKNLLLLCVSKCPLLIKKIPADLQTKNMCKIAIVNDPTLFRYVINQDYEICYFVIKYSNDCNIFSYIDENILESYDYDEQILKYIYMKPTVFKYIKNQTEELCMKIINISPTMIHYVKNKTQKIWTEALKNDNELLLDIEQEIFDMYDNKNEFYDVVTKILKQSLIFKQLTIKLPLEIYMKLVKYETSNIQYVKEEYIQSLLTTWLLCI